MGVAFLGLTVGPQSDIKIQLPNYMTQERYDRAFWDLTEQCPGSQGVYLSVFFSQFTKRLPSSKSNSSLRSIHFNMARMGPALPVATLTILHGCIVTLVTIALAEG